MSLPSFVGPLVSAFLFLLTVLGFCFYYCYWKPKRQKKNAAECKKHTANPESPSLRSSSCPKRVSKKNSSYDEEYFYGSGLSGYSASAAYCFHGGFPMIHPTYEQTWQPPIRKTKCQASLCKAKIEQCKKPSTLNKACCELRVDVNNEGTVKKPCISRQLSSDSHGSRKVCHLQVIQECEEEKEEKDLNEEVSEIKNKDLESGECNIVAT